MVVKEIHGVGRWLCLVSIACLAFTAQASLAQNVVEDKDLMANVEELLNVIGLPEQVDKTASEVLSAYSAKVVDDNLNEASKALVNQYQAEVSRLIMGVLSWEAMGPTYIAAYKSRLSAQNVEDALEFYRSESGEKFLAAQSGANLEAQQVATHLFEADLAAPLAEYARLLREGLAKLKEATR